MRVLVCDDEQLARDRLVRLVDTMEGVEVVAEAATAVKQFRLRGACNRMWC